MKTYELTYIISSEITNEEAEVFSSNVSSFVQNCGGVIIKSERPSPKTLSFPINKIGSGYITILEFQSEPEKIKEIQNMLEKDGKVLRSMVIIKKPVKAQKGRRTRKEPMFTSHADSAPAGTAIQNTAASEEPSLSDNTDKKSDKKVELEEIDKKLDEILGE